MEKKDLAEKSLEEMIWSIGSNKKGNFAKIINSCKIPFLFIVYSYQK